MICIIETENAPHAAESDSRSMPSAHVLVESLIKPIDESIQNSVQIDKIIYTGGTTKIPKSQSDEENSIGCANQAAYVNGSGSRRNDSQIDKKAFRLCAVHSNKSIIVENIRL